MKTLDWQQWLKWGQQYEKAGVGKGDASSKLGSTIVYNLLSMSLESYCMAIMDYHGTLPDNHTFTDLLDGLEKVCAVDPDLKRRILELEKCQQICAFDDFVVANIVSSAIREFQDVIKLVSKLAHAECGDYAKAG